MLVSLPNLFNQAIEKVLGLNELITASKRFDSKTVNFPAILPINQAGEARLWAVYEGDPLKRQQKRVET